MVPIAYRGLCHLRNQRLGEAQQKVLQLAATLEFILQEVSTQAVGMPRTLHDRTTRRALASHEQGNANRAFVTRDGDFRRGAVLQYIEQGDDALRGEKHMTHPGI